MVAVPDPDSSAAPVIDAEHVAFAYGAAPVLTDVTFRLDKGEFAALVGPNGSGKSTLLRILLGLLRPSAGRVAILGQEPRQLDDRYRIGYVPQRPELPPDLPATVEEVVPRRPPGPARVVAVARRRGSRRGRPRPRAVALSDLRRRRMHELSGGQQQRVLIAKALVGDPELLVLDEPIAGVDAESQRLFRDSLVHLAAEHGASVLLVSHELGAVAEDLDRVIVLKRTVLFDGKPQDLAARGVSLGIHAEDLPLWLEGLG